MKRLLFLSMIIMISLSACAEPSKEDLNRQLDKTGESISQESYQVASEKIRVVEDWWHFQHSNYKKKDAKKVDRLIRQVENSLAVPNKKKSKEAWRRLERQWRKMNRK